MGKRFPTIQLGFTRAKKVQIWTIDDGNPHVFFNPFSHALNCATSSGLSTGGAPAPVGGLGGATFASPAKNWSNEKPSEADGDNGGVFPLATGSFPSAGGAASSGEPAPKSSIPNASPNAVAALESPLDESACGNIASIEPGNV